MSVYIHFKIRQRGAVLVDNLKIDNIDEIIGYPSEEIALSFEFKLSLNAYLKDLVASPVKSLADVIAFNKEHPKLVSIYMRLLLFMDNSQELCYLLRTVCFMNYMTVTKLTYAKPKNIEVGVRQKIRVDDSCIESTNKICLFTIRVISICNINHL
jgi:hypothetical protein